MWLGVLPPADYRVTHRHMLVELSSVRQCHQQARTSAAVLGLITNLVCCNMIAPTSTVQTTPMLRLETDMLLLLFLPTTS